MSAREIGHHLQTRWINGTLAGGWTYQGRATGARQRHQDQTRPG
jgi:hypothetical protein